jgi:tetratricopeptide (TPR) repeat protein
MSSRGKQTIKSLKSASEARASEQLEKAAEYLKFAVDADSSYLPAKINLAVTLLYLGKPLEARIYIQQLRELEPDHSHYAELEALAIYEESDSELDRWPNAVTRLKKLIDKESSATSASLLYNLARLLEVRSKTEESKPLWNLLAKQNDGLPMPTRMEVCSKQKVISLSECIKVKKLSNNTAPTWKWPLQITTLQKITPQQTKQLATWDKLEFDWYEGDLYGQIYTNLTNQSQVLVLGQFVQMQVIKNIALGGIDKIKASCPQTLLKRELASGTVFSCDQWAVLLRNHEIQEAWWIAR